ncbi:MAG: nucleoside-diphosphate sugar epimerase [Candidatus Iainarchaeum archaeon]|uniref:Nucleoside-diphosphate sugar epimerase n=1 Tax=Candidatus Iainarchaeum sp. TaxID=3101447 RepID=A0A497JF34_9ARCH|nr:MAG: nucleoside-diphosphate sugar epimerase [Candidatus Diapherotrites archaeon]
MIRKILVTGSSGVIGTRLCEKLLNEGYEVTGVDKRTNKWNKTVNNLTIKCDLLDTRAIKMLPTDFDLVFHLAANSRVMESVEEPEKGLENITMTFNILNFLRKNKISKIAFASSREVYGEGRIEPYKEADVILDNIKNPYAASKVACEALIQAFKHCYGVEYVIFRLSNVYGMYDETDRVIPLFIKLLKQNKPLKIYGEDKSLDFIYIDDVVDGMIRAIKKFDKIKNNTFNLCSGKVTKIVEVAQTLKKITDSKSKIQICPERTGEVSYFRGDFSKAHDSFGFAPKTDLEKGLRLAVSWYCKNLYL